MFIPIVAAIVFLVGAGGLVLSSLAPIVGDSVFNFAAACLVAGPLIFFFYVIIGLCVEFIQANRAPEVGVVAFGSPAYAQAAYPSHFVYDGLPEGLRRERKGPLNPGSGRANRDLIAVPFFVEFGFATEIAIQRVAQKTKPPAAGGFDVSANCDGGYFSWFAM